MITGYNANVRHGGRLFHVQTEDSGRLHPHVITHLYHEGTILVSERRDYAELAGAPELDARVRELMEEQHAAVLERLRRGELDGVIAARLAAAELATPAAPGTAPGAARRARAEAPGPASRPASAPRAADAKHAPSASAPAASAASGRACAFGEGIVSERPLDELILEYLVARARDRARGARGSRSEG
jgi:hypothetical protein